MTLVPRLRVLVPGKDEAQGEAGLAVFVAIEMPGTSVKTGAAAETGDAVATIAAAQRLKSQDFAT
jgi:uncharacterized membrane protein